MTEESKESKKQSHKKAYLIIFLAAFLMSSGVAGSFYLTLKKSRDLNQNKADQAKQTQEQEQLNQIEATESLINQELAELEQAIEDINLEESYLDDSPAL